MEVGVVVVGWGSLVDAAQNSGVPFWGQFFLFLPHRHGMDTYAADGERSQPNRRFAHCYGKRVVESIGGPGGVWLMDGSIH